MGIVLVAFLAARIRVPSCYHDDINLETHQLGRKLREPIALTLRVSVLDGDVLSFYVATLAQSQPNSLGTGGITSCVATPIDILSAGTFFGRCASATEAKRKEHGAKHKYGDFSLHVFLCSFHSTLDTRPREIGVVPFMFV